MQQNQAKYFNELVNIFPALASPNIDAMMDQVNQRSMDLWRTHLVPELGREQLTNFELELDTLGMRARLVVPSCITAGYSYAGICHALAGGEEAEREQAALTAGLGMLVIAIFDRILDVFPERFADLETRIRQELFAKIQQGQVPDIKWDDTHAALNNGVVNLLALYMRRTLEHSVNADCLQHWQTTLFETFDAEMRTTELKHDQLDADEELLEKLLAPSTGLYRFLALGACTAIQQPNIKPVLEFADTMGRLTWMIDDYIDIEEDKNAGRWSGIQVRYALSDQVSGNRDINKQYIDDCLDLLNKAKSRAGKYYWMKDDPFTLFDIQLGFINLWLNGPTDFSDKVNVVI